MATNARLHWFWRGTFAVLAGAVGNYVFVVALVMFAPRAHAALTAFYWVAAMLLAPVPVVIVYGLLGRHFGPRVSDGELHCRRCDHILRSLSEPRCPECGETI